MRTYWLRIALGAFAIFAVGMLGWTLVQRGKRAVKDVVESSDPITFPLALIPFQVDGRSLGTLRQVQVLRSEPEKVKAVNFRVRLADSVSDAEMDNCVLVVGGSLEHIQSQHVFSCVTSADTAGSKLAPIGQVKSQQGRTWVLYAKEGALDSIKIDFGRHEAMADSIRQARQEFADSIREVEQERADSIREAARERSDSIREAAEAMSDSIRHHVDSVLHAAGPELERARELTPQAKKAKAPTPAPAAKPKP